MSKRNRVILVALPTVLVAAMLLVLLNWHIPTRVRVTLTADRVFLKIAGQEKSTILDSIALRSLVIEKFETVKIQPERLSVPPPSNLTTSSRQTAIANHITIFQLPVVITPRESRVQPNVTFTSETPGSSTPIIVDAINAQPRSEVLLEQTEDLEDLILRLDGQRSSGSISVTAPFKLAVNQSDINGIRSTTNLAAPVNLVGRLLTGSAVEFDSQKDSLVLTITAAPEKSTAVVPHGHLPVAAIKFERQDDSSGKVLSSLTKDTSCEITYPDYGDNVKKATVASPDFLWLDDVQGFSVEELTYTPGKKGLTLKLLGIADKIASGSAEHTDDLRVTAYAALWNNHQVIAIFVCVCWVAGTMVGMYKFVIKDQ